MYQFSWDSWMYDSWSSKPSLCFLFFFSITVISTTMPFKVSVMYFCWPATCIHDMLHISVCIVGTRMCAQKDISSLVIVLPIYIQKNCSSQSWTLNPKPWFRFFFFFWTLVFPPLSSALCLSKCLLMYFCWPKPLESQRAKCIVDIILHKSACIVSTGTCE